jgi:hypothetical protein
MQRDESRAREAREFDPITLFMARMCHSCRICPFKPRRANYASGDSRGRREPWCPGWTAHKRVYGSAPVHGREV